MSNQDPANDLPIQNGDENAIDEKIDRRSVAAKLGKFMAYTAPALIALTTAKDACAN